uniref:MBOAT family O-acyltransferase n=1 Tax=Ferriphaselus sp. R-1 TaxID=1485544 RepID=UPI001F270E92
LYLPVVLAGFFWLARWSERYAAGWLALASLFFYGYWNPAYVGLLLGSIAFNYTLGVWIAQAGARQQHRRQRHLLVFAIAADLALLAYFKYANFFLDSLNAVAGSKLSLGEIILPLGISFFTFTQIAFLVDTFQSKVKEFNFVHYTLFVTYFPHLIAGPVLHHKEMMPQFAPAAAYRVNWENVAHGLMLFTVGLCKKTLGADALAPYANGVFDGVQSGMIPTSYEAWAGALAYTLQLYFDFSGYTDMALGIALLFNIRLPVNFDSPYKATSIIDFWRRWHMTLSRFLRDYLYIPLGGNRKGKLWRHINLMTTMLLGGLWHGAGWTYVVWGGLHGLFLMVNHLWRELLQGMNTRWVPGWLSGLLGFALTFIAVVSAWVVFRSPDISHAKVMLEAMFGIHAKPIALDAVLHGHLLLTTDLSGRELVKLLIPALAWVWLLPNSNRLKFLKGSYLLALLQAAVVLYLLHQALDHFGNYSPFLYFQF